MYKILIFGFTLSWVTSFSQNIIVNSVPPRNTPIWLAQNYIAGSGMFIYSPIGSNGLPLNQPPSVQLGTFTNSNPNFGLDSGVVMVTSNAYDIVPGQNGTFSSFPSQTPSANLTTVLNSIGSTNSNLYDRASIQFSFLASSDSLKFDYIFGSKEYTGYTCSSFNDVFGFFLIGPGINGAPLYNSNGSLNIDSINIALIPGTNTPVAINTINQGFPSGGNSASNCLIANPNYVAHSAYYNANTGGTNTVSLEGYTDVLTARAQVVCGIPYTLKLMIADVSDGILNSAIFIGSSGFEVPKLDLFVEYYDTDSVVYEGCAAGRLIANRVGTISDTCTIDLIYSGSAINGIDIIGLPSQIQLLPFQASDTLEFFAFEDNIPESVESLKVSYLPISTNCSVFPADSTEILIMDKNTNHIPNSIIELFPVNQIAQFDTGYYRLNYNDYDSIYWQTNNGTLISQSFKDTAIVVWDSTTTVGELTSVLFRSSCADSLFFSQNISLIGIDESSSIQISPNPTKRIVRIELSNGLIGEHFEVVSATGVLFKRGKIVENVFELDFEGATPGVYLFKFFARSGLLASRVVLLN